MDTTSDPRPGNQYVASLECHPDPSTTITYRQYSRLHDMANAFDNVFARDADELELFDEDAGCESLATYTVDGEEQGSSICRYDESTGAVSIAWTYEPLATIGTLERIDDDATAARDTWTYQGGPDAETYAIPRRLSQRVVQRAAAELLALIPEAKRNDCAATDLSRPSGLVPGPAIWLDAEVVCNGPPTPPGLPVPPRFPAKAIYRRYRNGQAYVAAYDPDRFLEFAEPNDAECPGGYETSWSLDDVDVGRLACYYSGVPGRGEAHLQWTYDPDQIVAEAYALQQNSAQKLYDWWERDAGPQP